MKKITQDAGRKALGEFAPDFAHYNDDILFGENWNNGDIDHKTRCIITVVALMSSGITDSSLKYHLENAKKAGVTKKEIAAVVTHVFMRAGPKRGRYSTWQRKSGRKKTPRAKWRRMKIR